MYRVRGGLPILKKSGSEKSVSEGSLLSVARFHFVHVLRGNFFLYRVRGESSTKTKSGSEKSVSKGSLLSAVNFLFFFLNYYKKQLRFLIF